MSGAAAERPGAGVEDAVRPAAPDVPPGILDRPSAAHRRVVAHEEFPGQRLVFRGEGMEGGDVVVVRQAIFQGIKRIAALSAWGSPPASRRNTRMPASARRAATVPPPAPEPDHHIVVCRLASVTAISPCLQCFQEFDQRRLVRLGQIGSIDMPAIAVSPRGIEAEAFGLGGWSDGAEAEIGEIQQVDAAIEDLRPLVGRGQKIAQVGTEPLWRSKAPAARRRSAAAQHSPAPPGAPPWARPASPSPYSCDWHWPGRRCRHARDRCRSRPGEWRSRRGCLCRHGSRRIARRRSAARGRPVPCRWGRGRAGAQKQK